MKPLHLLSTSMTAAETGAFNSVVKVTGSGDIDMRAIPRALRGFGIKADIQSPEQMFAALNGAVSALRSEIESRPKNAVSDVVLNEKLGTINGTITNLEAALQAIQSRVDANNVIAAPGIIGDIQGNPEYIGNFKTHMRVGDRATVEVQNAMSIGSAPDGGYLAPIEWDRSITDQLVLSSPIRANSEVINISGQGFSRLYAVGQPGSGWVGETAARPETSTPQFVPLSFVTGEIYANPAITQQALDDPAVSLESWLANGVQEEFSRQENIAFLSGNGVNKPRGILTYVTGGSNAATHPFGAILAEVAGAAAVLVADDFIDLIMGHPSERITGNAKFYMNRLTQAAIRKLKNTDGDYIWQMGLVAGQPSSLLSHPIVDVTGMPLIATGNNVALFGDMKMTYLVVDRVGIRVLRDPYTNKPYVMFYTTKRVGGGVQNPEYMRALKMA